MISFVKNVLALSIEEIDLQCTEVSFQLDAAERAVNLPAAIVLVKRLDRLFDQRLRLTKPLDC